MNERPTPRPAICFSGFEFFPALHKLERDGDVVKLSSRAIDILAVLTERPGEVISKRELLARAWPDALVVEAALRFHMVALRRALGDGKDGQTLISTVPGRGYCFVGEIRSLPELKPNDTPRSLPSPRPLPASPTGVVGREAVVEEMLERLELQRLVTIVGPGGIGKTTVARVAAHQWTGAHGAVAVFVDLGALAPDSQGVAEALCATLGIAPQGDSALDCAIAYLRTSRSLVVFDTCERVVEAAARLAESLVASAPDVRVLATSRQALQAEGEFVYRIEPLAAPPPSVELTVQEALGYPAVQLFVQCATANHFGFAINDQQAATVGAICRELDGMALAIELAAGCVGSLGIEYVADHLKTAFALTWPGRRTATPRQQTLDAALSWSHDLLTPVEQIVFRRLSVFVGSFTLERAVALLSPALEPSTAIEAMSNLVSRSLIHTDAGQTPIRYRLLDTTRAFAELKLAEADEHQTMHRRHALVYQAALAERDVESDALRDELPGNLRAALGWAFGPHGDEDLGVVLANAASPLWHEQSLVFDTRTWTHKALAVLDAGADRVDTLQIRLALVSALLVYDGLTDDVHRSWRATYEAAERLGEKDMPPGGLTVLWGHSFRMGRYREAEDLGERAAALFQASADSAPPGSVPWLRGVSAHYLGRQTEARVLFERVLRDDTEEVVTDVWNRFGFDREVAALRFLSNVLFLEGRGREASLLSDEAIAKATDRVRALSLCDSRAWRLFNVFYARDGGEVDRRTAELIADGSRQGMANAVGIAQSFRGLWLCDSGDWASGAAMVRQGMTQLAATNNFVLHPLLEAELHLRAAQRAQDISLIEPEVVPWRENDPETWVTPEIRRIEGELASLAGDDVQALRLFDEAEAMAMRQGAARWRLRAALSSADLELRRERPIAAAERLSSVLQAFSADEIDEDLQRARQIVASAAGVNQPR